MEKQNSNYCIAFDIIMWITHGKKNFISTNQSLIHQSLGALHPIMVP